MLTFMPISPEFSVPWMVIGLLTIACGVLVLAWPQLLYSVLAAYLIISGILGFYYGSPPSLYFPPIIAGGLILVFPNLLSYLLATLLFIIGLIMCLSLGLLLVGGLAIMMAVVIFLAPRIIAYLIASYFILIGVLLIATRATTFFN